MPGPDEAARETEEVAKELTEAEKSAAAARGGTAAGGSLRALLMIAAEGASADLRAAEAARVAGRTEEALARAQAAERKILAVLSLQPDPVEPLPNPSAAAVQSPTAPTAMLGSTAGVPVLRDPLPGEAAAAAWMQKAGIQPPFPAPSAPSAPGVFSAIWRGVLSLFQKAPAPVPPPPAPPPTVEIGTVLDGPSGRIVLRGEFPNPQAAGKAYKDMLKFSQEQQRMMMQAAMEHDRAIASAAAADQAAAQRARAEGIPESWIERALANRQPRVIQIVPPAPPPSLPSPPAAAGLASPLPSGASAPAGLPSPEEFGRAVAAAVRPPPPRPLSGARLWFKRLTWVGGIGIGGFALLEGILSSRARSKTFVYEDIKQLGMGVQFSILHAKDPESANRLARLYWDEALPAMGDDTFWSWVPFVNQLAAFKQYTAHSKEYMRALEESLPELEMTPAAREAWKRMTPGEKIDYARRVADEIEKARPAGAAETRVPPSEAAAAAGPPLGAGAPTSPTSSRSPSTAPVSAGGASDEGRLTDEEFRSLTSAERTEFLKLRGAARRQYIRDFRARHPSHSPPPSSGHSDLSGEGEESGAPPSAAAEAAALAELLTAPTAEEWQAFTRDERERWNMMDSHHRAVFLQEYRARAATEGSPRAGEPMIPEEGGGEPLGPPRELAAPVLHWTTSEWNDLGKAVQDRWLAMKSADQQAFIEKQRTATAKK